MTSPFSSDYSAQVLARFEGDKELLCEVIQLFLEDSPPALAALRAAVAARDGKAIHKTAHTLKGSVSNFLAPAGQSGGDDPAQQTAAAALVVERMAAAEQLAQIDDALAKLEAALTHLWEELKTIIAP